MPGFDLVEPVGGRGRYLLRLATKRDAPLLIPLRFQDEAGTPIETVFVPKPDGVPLYLRLKERPVAIACRSGEVASVSVAGVGKHHPRQLARLAPASRTPLAEVPGGISLSPCTTRPTAAFRAGMQALKDLHAQGLVLNPPARNCSVPAVLGWAPGGDSADPLSSGERVPRVAVVLHLEDGKLWPEIEGRLREFTEPFHLIVTGCDGDPDVTAAIRRSAPSAEFVSAPGGDIGALCHLLYEGVLDAFELICKLNVSQSSLQLRQRIVGDVCRRVAIDAMIGSAERIGRILSRFDEHPHLGMSGPSALLRPNEAVDHASAWGGAKETTLELAGRIGIPASTFRLDFFEGGTCWLRTGALEPLRDLNLSSSNFAVNECEDLAAAVTRLIKPAVESAGFYARALPADGLDCRGSRDVLKAPWSLQRPPGSLAGQKVCLFVSLASKGRFPPHALHHMKALKASDITVLALAVVPAGRKLQVADPGPDCADGIACRANEGYDFAVWAAAMRRLPEIWDAEALLLVNDSVIGPLRPLDEIMARIEASDADVVGLTDCYRPKRHVQSYFLYFKREALGMPAVRQFWRNVRSRMRKEDVVASYEIDLLGKLQAAGLHCETLFATRSPSRTQKPLNPTINQWRELLERGFPFVKLQLLRDNPAGEDLSGWRGNVGADGDGANLVESFLAETAPQSAALRVD